MKLVNRLSAAFNAFRGKAPQGNHVDNPFFYGYSTNGRSVQAQKVNPQQLRTFSETAIPRRAISYIRDQVAKLEWDITPVEGKKLTAAQKKQVDVAKNVLNKPNSDDSWNTFVGQLVEDMLVVGLGAAEIKQWNGNERNPYLLYPMDATSVQIYLDWNGSPTMRRYAQVGQRGQVIDFTPNEMMVWKHIPRTNTPFGLSPLEAAFQQIKYLLDAQAYAGQTASTATPKKLLYMGQEITDTQLKEFRQYFKDEIEGRSTIPIVGGTDAVHSVELGQTSDNALFLQWQSFLIAVIANAFGLDAMKFNAFTGINRSTGDTLDDVSDEGAIRPMAHAIEQHMNQFLALMGLEDVACFKFRFTTSFSDRKSLSVIHQIYGQLDVLTINEIRSEMGKPPLQKDPETGISKGNYTLSEYRAKYGAQMNPLAQEEDSPVKTESDNQPGLGDTGHEATNNGVDGAHKLNEKSMNKRSDSSLEAN